MSFLFFLLVGTAEYIEMSRLNSASIRGEFSVFVRTTSHIKYLQRTSPHPISNLTMCHMATHGELADLLLSCGLSVPVLFEARLWHQNCDGISCLCSRYKIQYCIPPINPHILFCQYCLFGSFYFEAAFSCATCLTCVCFPSPLSSTRRMRRWGCFCVCTLHTSFLKLF